MLNSFTIVRHITYYRHIVKMRICHFMVLFELMSMGADLVVKKLQDVF